MISPNKNKTADDGGGQCHSNMPVYMGMVLAIRQSLIEYATSWILVSSEKSTGTQSAVCLTKLLKLGPKGMHEKTCCLIWELINT